MQRICTPISPIHSRQCSSFSRLNYLQPTSLVRLKQDIKTARRSYSFISRLKPAAPINTAGQNASRWPLTNCLRAARLKSIQTECPVLNSRERAGPLFQETFRKCERLRVTGHDGEISTARSGRMLPPGAETGFAWQAWIL